MSDAQSTLIHSLTNRVSSLTREYMIANTRFRFAHSVCSNINPEIFGYIELISEYPDHHSTIHGFGQRMYAPTGNFDTGEYDLDSPETPDAQNLADKLGILARSISSRESEAWQKYAEEDESPLVDQDNKIIYMHGAYEICRAAFKAKAIYQAACTALEAAQASDRALAALQVAKRELAQASTKAKQ